MYHYFNNHKKSIIIAVLFFAGMPVYSQRLADNEIKKNITAIVTPLQKLVQLEPKVFEFETGKYKHLKLQQGRQYGFMAENVQAVLPELVSVKTVSYMFAKNGFRDASIHIVDEASLIPLLVASIKEQQAQIEQLKVAVEELKNKKAVAAN